MKWSELPARTSISMGKADVEKLRRSPTKAFVSGMLVGACALLVIQGNTNDKPDIDKPNNGPVATATPNQ